MKKSLVMIVPQAAMPQANAMLNAMGWPDDNFSVPLLTKGAAEPCHFGLRASVNTDFVATLEQSLAAEPALAAALIADYRDDLDRQGQFEAVIQAAGLAVVVPDVA